MIGAGLSDDDDDEEDEEEHDEDMNEKNFTKINFENERFSLDSDDEDLGFKEKIKKDQREVYCI